MAGGDGALILSLDSMRFMCLELHGKMLFAGKACGFLSQYRKLAF